MLVLRYGASVMLYSAYYLLFYCSLPVVMTRLALVNKLVPAPACSISSLSPIFCLLTWKHMLVLTWTIYMHGPVNSAIQEDNVHLSMQLRVYLPPVHAAMRFTIRHVLEKDINDSKCSLTGLAIKVSEHKEQSA